MEFRSIKIAGGSTVEITDEWGDRIAILDPSTMEVYPVGPWSRMSAQRLARKVRQTCHAFVETNLRPYED